MCSAHKFGHGIGYIGNRRKLFAERIPCRCSYNLRNSAVYILLGCQKTFQRRTKPGSNRKIINKRLQFLCGHGLKFRSNLALDIYTINRATTHVQTDRFKQLKHLLRCYILRFSNRFRQIGRKTSHLCKICSGSFTNRRHPLVLLSDGNVEHVLLQLFVVLAQTLNDFALVVEPVCQIRMRFARLNGITSDILLRKLPHFFSQSLSGSFHRIDFRSRAFNYTVGIFSKQFDISHQRSQTIAHICDVFHDKLKRRIYWRSSYGQNLKPHVLQPTKLSNRRVHTDLFRFFSNAATFHRFKKLIIQIELRFQRQIERCSLSV